MKPKDKINDLILEGFSLDTLEKLTEKQINLLHSKILKEQATGSVTKKTSTSTTYTIPSGTAKTSGAEVDGMAIKTDSAGNIKLTKTQATEGKTKKGRAKNPWAICTASLSDEFGTSERSEWTKPQMKKYERCVMDVKKSMKEGKNPYEPIIENKIMEIVSKHITPKMTKKDLLNTIVEQGTKEKEKVKPKTTPKRPPNPFKDPSPGTKEKPRGQSEKMKRDFIKLIKNIIGQ